MAAIADAAGREVTSFGGPYALGIPFGLSTCPACTPMVLPVLSAAMATGEAWGGAALRPRIERAGGVLRLLAALHLLYQGATATGAVPPLEFLLADLT